MSSINEKTELFQPSENFPKGAPLPQREDVLSQLALFGVSSADEIKLIDSTHDAADIRLNFIIDKKLVLRFTNAPGMSEKRMAELNRLIGRYNDFGTSCPRFITGGGKYLHQWRNLQCYLSEYVDLPIASDSGLDTDKSLYREVQALEARFAERYRDFDLSQTFGMYSLFDLSPFDIAGGIDEKQENFNSLIEILQNKNEFELAERLVQRHDDIRAKLRAVYKQLPRCVFQADENTSNLLVDENGHLEGLIDFNLAGTEVIVNQLVNIVGFDDYAEHDEKPIGAKARLDHALGGFRESMAHMLSYYRANDLEKRAIAWYGWIVLIAQWPHFCWFKKMLESELRSEILELLALLAELPEAELRIA